MDQEPELCQRLLELDTEVRRQLLNGWRYVRLRLDTERDEDDPFIQVSSEPDDGPEV